MNFRAGILLPGLFLLLGAVSSPVFGQEDSSPVSADADTADTSATDVDSADADTADADTADADTADADTADADAVRVTIADPFIELHTGPGKGYPIYYVVDRGDRVTILRRKTDWFRIITDDGKTGWASREQMQQTLLPSGEQFEIRELGAEDFEQRKWVVGITGGEFDSAPIFTLFGAYSFTENLAAELHLGKSVGDVSSATLWKTNLVMQPMPDWKYSPYMTLGLGQIEVDPSATLIVPDKSTNSFSQFGFGIQRYVSRSFLLRFEINEYVIFSPSNTSDNNEVVSEWKFGFAVFF